MNETVISRLFICLPLYLPFLFSSGKIINEIKRNNFLKTRSIFILHYFQLLFVSFCYLVTLVISDYLKV